VKQIIVTSGHGSDQEEREGMLDRMQ